MYLLILSLLQRIFLMSLMVLLLIWFITLSLHDALPICGPVRNSWLRYRIPSGRSSGNNLWQRGLPQGWAEGLAPARRLDALLRESPRSPADSASDNHSNRRRKAAPRQGQSSDRARQLVSGISERPSPSPRACSYKPDRAGKHRKPLDCLSAWQR